MTCVLDLEGPFSEGLPRRVGWVVNLFSILLEAVDPLIGVDAFRKPESGWAGCAGELKMAFGTAGTISI